MNDRLKCLVFRLNDHGQGPELLRQVFLERGWQEFEEDEHEEYDWNLWWRTSRFRNCDYDQLQPWQRLNHYPKSTAITRKDSLARNLKRMKAVYGASAYNFSPGAFNLPNDYTRFVAEYTRLKEKSPDQCSYWICKPADLSRGRGIFIFKQLSELQYDCNAVVQRYITNPLLISGYKFDLRIYVAVTSFQPLNMYVYNEGLVRFSTEKYDLDTLGNMFAHLTNTSINVHGPSYASDKERVGPGCKWTLTQLRSYIKQANIDDKVLFARIVNIVILTMLIQAPLVPKSHNCFEVYGFDIMIDENLKPWLLEVNFSPALSSDCQVDLLVKKPLIYDLIDLLKFSEEDKNRGVPKFKQKNNVPEAFVPGQRRNRISTSLIRKSVLNRLPDIQACVASSLMGQETNSAESVSSLSGIDEVSRDVVPIVPGCGLPSVQQPQQRILSGDNSGRSSPDSSDSQHVDKFPHKSYSSFGPTRGVSIVKMSRQKTHDFNESSRNTPKSSLRREHKHSDYSLQRNGALSRFSGSSEYSNENGRWLTNHSGTTQDFTGFGSDRTSAKSKQSQEKHKATQLRRRLSHDHLMSTMSSNEASTRPPSFNSLTTMSVLLNTRDKSPPSSRQNYDRPWRTKPSVGKASCQAKVAAIPQKVGGFVLAFPFSETTRRCSNTDNFDVKRIIQECHRYLKEVTSQSFPDTPADKSEAVVSRKSVGIPQVWLNF